MRPIPSPRARLALVLLCLCASLLGAEPTSHPGLFRFRLPSGLELFVYERHDLPLARIQVSFKAGALVQGPETAGHFHLLEHLLFGGEEASSSLASRLERLGAAEWNGASSAEYLGFWLDLPAVALREGLELWAELLSPASFPPEAVEAERARVLAELAARAEEPDAIYEAALTRRLFPRAPWRRDPAGSPEALAKASAEGLARLKAAWLGPDKAALFVAGDVDAREVYAAALEAFSAWKPQAGAARPALPAHPKVGLPRPTFLAYPDPSLPEGLALVELRYRGPDLATDPAASYAADLWSSLLAAEGGRFQSSVQRALPGLRGADSLSAYYVSQGEGGILSVSAALEVGPALPALERVWKFKESVRGVEMDAMRREAAYFSAADYEAARRRLLEARSRALDTAEGFLSELAFFWAAASADYFLGWPEAIAATGRAELAAFLEVYVLRNLEVAAIRMNPADFERERRAFAASGFEILGAANAFWWR